MQIFAVTFALSFISGCILFTILKQYPSKAPVLNNDNRASILGGTGFLLSFFLGLLCFLFYARIPLPAEITYILLFSVIIFVTGLVDDFREFSLTKKVIVQVLIFSLFLLKAKPVQIYYLPMWGNYIISFLWIMGITNVFNLLDIGDGLCAGVSSIAAVSFFIALSLSGNFITAGLFAGLSGALLSFLIFNFPKAKVVLGNSGSHFLGFLFAALSIHGDYATLENPFSVLIPLVILAFPIIDTLYIITARVKKGIIPIKKSRDHIFLRLISSGKKIRPVLFSVYFVTFLWGLSGVLLIGNINILFLSVFLISVLLTIKLILSARVNK